MVSFLENCDFEDKAIQESNISSKIEEVIKQNSYIGIRENDFRKKSIGSLNSIYNSHEPSRKSVTKKSSFKRKSSINNISKKMGIIENSASLKSFTEYPYSKSHFKSDNALEYNSRFSIDRSEYPEKEDPQREDEDEENAI